MTNDEIVNELERALANYKINIDEKDVFDYFPLFALTFWQVRTAELPKRKSAYLSAIRSNISLDTLFNNFTPQRVLAFKHNRRLKDTEKLFFSRPNHFTAIKGQFKKFDRVLDPLYEQLSDSKNCKKVIIGRLNNVDPYHKALYWFARKSHKTMNIELEMERVDEFISITGASDVRDKFIKALIRNMSLFNVSFRYWEKVFQKSKKLETLYISTWYSPDVMGIIAAAKEHSIKTVDVQHGIQLNSHPMYLKNFRSRSHIKLITPDSFLKWEECSQKLDHKFGYMWPYYWREKYEMRNRTMYITKEVNLLVSLEQPTIDCPNRIPSFLLEFLMRNRTVRVNLRIHPNDPSGRRILQNYLKNMDLGNVQISDGSSDLYADLDHTTHHLSRHSSVCKDADFFKVRNIIFGDGEASFKNEIKENKYAWIPNSADELYSILTLGAVPEFALRDMKEEYETGSGQLGLFECTVRIDDNNE